MQSKTDEEEQTRIFDVKAERVETKINKAQAMEIEAQMFEAERDRVRQIWRNLKDRRLGVFRVEMCATLTGR